LLTKCSIPLNRISPCSNSSTTNIRSCKQRGSVSYSKSKKTLGN
jgi:hypothetical protein